MLAIVAVIELWKREINKNTKKLIIITIRVGRNEQLQQRKRIASQVLLSKCFSCRSASNELTYIAGASFFVVEYSKKM